jgi:hypothetical protein
MVVIVVTMTVLRGELIEDTSTPTDKYGVNMKIVLTKEQLCEILKQYFYDEHNVPPYKTEITFDCYNETDFCKIVYTEHKHGL